MLRTESMSRTAGAAVLAGLVLVLSGCTGTTGSDDPAAAAPTTTAPSTEAPTTPASDPASDTASDPAPSSTAGAGAGLRWAGSTQFLQVEDARSRGGAVVLRVRPAKKENLGESFETVTIGGPYVEVETAADARAVLLEGGSGPVAELADGLDRRSAGQRDEAFDVTFDDNGRVTVVEWLYVP